jgi:membrane protease YdiL (CAAX protease family)
MLDSLLTVCLLGLVPAYGLWRAWAQRAKPPAPKARRYLQAILLAISLLSLLALDWWRSGRSAAALGLQWPPSLPGWIGMGIAATFLVGMSIAMGRAAATRQGVQADEAAALLPDTRMELWLFIAFSIVIGAGWEILFRGYLIWALEPRLTTMGAVIAAAAAYGLAHGYKTPRQLIGSLLAALIFTTGYVVTRSLWWLMLIHAGMPLLTALMRRQGYRRNPGAALAETSRPA